MLFILMLIATFDTWHQVVCCIELCALVDAQAETYVTDFGDAANGKHVLLGDQRGTATLVDLTPPFQALKFVAHDRIASLFWPADNVILIGGHSRDTESFLLKYFTVHLELEHKACHQPIPVLALLTCITNGIGTHT
jgi:hypothetical protein